MSIITSLLEHDSNFFSALYHLENFKSIDMENQLHFRVPPVLNFPTGDIKKIKEKQGVVRIDATFMGLFGVNGILPEHHTLDIIKNRVEKLFAYEDFLNIFHQRPLYLYYLAWRRSQFLLFSNTKQKNKTPIESTWEGLSGASNTDVDTLGYRRYFTSFFLQSTKTADNLSTLLSHYFSLNITVSERYGHYLHLSKSQQLALSYQKKNNCLGWQTYLGSKVYDYQHCVHITIHCPQYEQFHSLLPDKHLLNEVMNVATDYLGVEYLFIVRLHIDTKRIPDFRLSSQPKLQLGWNTWLRQSNRFGFKDDVKFKTGNDKKVMFC